MIAVRRRGLHRLMATVVGFGLIAAACGDSDESVNEDSGSSQTTNAGSDDGASGDGDEVFTLTLRNSWIPDDLYLPISLARARGYYEDEGINLVDQVGNGGATAASLVASGQVMIGTGEAANVVIARANGLPLVAFGTQIQEQPAGLAIRRGGDITDWDDLDGKTVAGTAASSSYATYLATASLKGVDLSEVSFENLSPGAQFAAIESGEVDAAITFAGNIAVLPNEDEYDFLSFAEAGFESPSTTFFTTEAFLAENPEVLEGFLRATLRALREVLEDPAAATEAAEAMATQYALVKPDEQLARIAAQRSFYLNDIVEEHGLGWNDLQHWVDLERALGEGEVIEESVDVEQAFTNDILDRIPADER